jgi:hypothetical protein
VPEILDEGEEATPSALLLAEPCVYRRLGVSETVATAASAIHFFTGNNIGPRGDLASRSLNVRLAIDRADPENRKFKHPDPVAWTEANRAEILRALYTILLGNPQLAEPREAASKTRFKMWWRLIGSAVEHADRQAPPVGDQKRDREPLDFQKLFVAQEEGEEESGSLADALAILARRWPDASFFKASDVITFLKKTELGDGNSGQKFTADARELRELLFDGAQHDPSTKSVGRRLNRHVDEPAWYGERTLTLRSTHEVSGGSKHAKSYYVEAQTT